MAAMARGEPRVVVGCVRPCVSLVWRLARGSPWLQWVARSLARAARSLPRRISLRQVACSLRQVACSLRQVACSLRQVARWRARGEAVNAPVAWLSV